MGTVQCYHGNKGRPVKLYRLQKAIDNFKVRYYLYDYKSDTFIFVFL